MPRSTRWYLAALGVTGVLVSVTACAAVTDGARQADSTGGVPRKAVLSGAPGRTVDGIEDAGAVELRTGTNRTRKLLTAPKPMPGARFGTAINVQWYSVAIEDRALFVGAPGLTVDGKPNAGGVYVYGFYRGEVTYAGLITQDSPDVPGEAQAGAEFGASLDSYFPDDECGDGAALGVGVPGMNVDGAEAAGGLVVLALQLWEHDVKFIHSWSYTLANTGTGVEPSPGDRLGTSVRQWLHYFDESCDGDGFFIGVPNATVAGEPNAGLVLLARGDTDGELFHPGVRGVPGRPQRGERFGAALDRTLVKGSGGLGITAIGAPGKRVDGFANAGSVYLLKETGRAEDSWEWYRSFDQSSPDNGTGEGDPVGGHAEAGDRFGTAVRFLESYAPWEKLPLLVGAPGEDLGDVHNAGAVFGLFAATGTHEGEVGGTPGTSHHFGATLSGNEFLDSNDVDHVIGIPGADDDTGAVAYGKQTSDGIDWQQWTLFSGDGQPGDGYGSAFDQGGR